ncbi:MAG: DMT family transporter [Thermodesulfobacteriota bacterium]
MIKNLLALIYVSVAWGSAFVLIKYTEQTIGPLSVQAGRCTIGFLALLIISLVLRRDLVGHAKNWFAWLVFAVLGIVLMWVAVGLGEEYITAGLTSVMVTVAPLVTFIITVFFLRTERFSVIGVIGLLVGALGLVFVVGLKNILGGSSVLIGALLIASGYTLFAINGIIAPMLAQNADPLAASVYYTGFATVMLWIITFIFGDPTSIKLTTGNITAELIMGVFSFASGFVVYYWLLNRAGPFFSSMTFYLIPIVGILGGFLVLSESIRISQVVGMMIVFLGVYLINRVKFKQG